MIHSSKNRKPKNPQEKQKFFKIHIWPPAVIKQSLWSCKYKYYWKKPESTELFQVTISLSLNSQELETRSILWLSARRIILSSSSYLQKGGISRIEYIFQSYRKYISGKLLVTKNVLMIGKQKCFLPVQYRYSSTFLKKVFLKVLSDEN